MAEEFDVIVVGAGFGGAACAGLLAKRGIKVLLLEKNSKAGGKAMAFSKNGFTYTAWPVVTAPIQDNMFERVLTELEMQSEVELTVPDPTGGAIYKNRKGEYMPMPAMPADSVMDPNLIFDWLEIAEEEREAALAVLMAITLMSPEDIDSLDHTTFEDFLAPFALPKSLYAYLLGTINDMCFVAPVDTVAASEAVRTLQMIFLRSGGLFCKGGIGRVAETFAKAVELNGGDVIYSARVKRILVEEGRVTGVETADGIFRAPIVVSNAGIQPTMLKLVDEEHLDTDHVQQIKALIPSWGLPGARYFLKEEVIKAPFGTVFSDDTYWTKEKFKRAEAGEFPEEIAVLYEVPSNYDENAAPKGKQIVLAAVWGPPDGNATKEDMKPWWDRCDQVMFRAFPELEEQIERVEHYSVRDVSALTRDCVLPNQGGECIGLGQVVDQCGGKKPSTESSIRGLFFVGCDAGGYGVGTQQATMSGINVADTVQEYHRSTAEAKE